MKRGELMPVLLSVCFAVLPTVSQSQDSMIIRFVDWNNTIEQIQDIEVHSIPEGFIGYLDDTLTVIEGEELHFGVSRESLEAKYEVVMSYGNPSSDSAKMTIVSGGSSEEITSDRICLDKWGKIVDTRPSDGCALFGWVNTRSTSTVVNDIRIETARFDPSIGYKKMVFAISAPSVEMKESSDLLIFDQNTVGQPSQYGDFVFDPPTPRGEDASLLTVMLKDNFTKISGNFLKTDKIYLNDKKISSADGEFLVRTQNLVVMNNILIRRDKYSANCRHRFTHTGDDVAFVCPWHNWVE